MCIRDRIKHDRREENLIHGVSWGRREGGDRTKPGRLEVFAAKTHGKANAPASDYSEALDAVGVSMH